MLVALNHISPHLRQTEGVRVAHDEQEVLRPGDCHVQPAQIGQESQLCRDRGVPKVVSSDTIENDYILLLALISVNTVDIQVIFPAVKHVLVIFL